MNIWRNAFCGLGVSGLIRFEPIRTLGRAGSSRLVGRTGLITAGAHENVHGVNITDRSERRVVVNVVVTIDRLTVGGVEVKVGDSSDADVAVALVVVIDAVVGSVVTETRSATGVMILEDPSVTADGAFRLVSLVSWGSGLAGVVTITGTENWVELCDDPPTLDVDLSNSGNAAAGSVECIYAGSENLRFFNGVTSDLLITET